MATNGPAPAEEKKEEVKTPDVYTNDRLKAEKNAPKEWQSDGLAQYVPYTNYKYDGDSFKEAEKEWNAHSPQYIETAEKERYTNDTESLIKVNAKAMKPKSTEENSEVPAPLAPPVRAPKDFYGEPQERKFEAPKAEGVTFEEPHQQRTLVNVLENDFDRIIKHNLQGVKNDGEKKAYDNKPAHPSEWHAKRIQGGDELFKHLDELNERLKACRLDANKADHIKAEDAQAKKYPNYPIKNRVELKSENGQTSTILALEKLKAAAHEECVTTAQSRLIESAEKNTTPSILFNRNKDNFPQGNNQYHPKTRAQREKEAAEAARLQAQIQAQTQEPSATNESSSTSRRNKKKNR